MSHADPLTDSESEEDNFEDGLNFQDQEVEENIEGIRRRLSDEVAVSRVGEALNQTLEADRDEEAPPRDHFSPVQVRFPVNAPALRPPAEAAAAEAVMVDFDQQNTEDGDKANELAGSIKVEFNPIDVRFWLSELEAKMLTANINKQWLKKTVLQRNLPTKQKEDVKALLTLTQTQAGG